jgi:hypothetical protein
MYPERLRGNEPWAGHGNPREIRLDWKGRENGTIRTAEN